MILLLNKIFWKQSEMKQLAGKQEKMITIPKDLHIMD